MKGFKENSRNYSFVTVNWHLIELHCIEWDYLRSQAVEPARTQNLLIIWKKIIAVIDTTFAIAKRKHEKSSYNHNFIIILSRVYNEPIQRASPFWLVSLINGALHRFRRGQGFESRTNLNCKSCVYNCVDLLSYNPSPRSSHIWFSYIHTWTSQTLM